ncbi:MAG: BMP family ABC transporter substrate-binding protein, partial [Lachnospiraceae bacterium]|nr:BMP family ABC transporter substrate-binding protein [Lachnospiraceae bacterium]
GYITSQPIPETIRSINAYTMGVRKANPSAKVLVSYVGSWNDSVKEGQIVKKMCDAGVDVFTHHQDAPYVIDVADDMGLYTTGYDFVYKDYSACFLTAALINWDVLYEKVLGDYISGRADFSDDYWLGLADNAVSLYPYSDLVSEETRALVESEKKRINSWRDVFSGEIYDNEGYLRCYKDERINDHDLFNNMDWLVEGAEIYE